MEALASLENFKNLGLQLLFAPVILLTGRPLPKKIPQEEREALAALEKLLNDAKTGLTITVERLKGGYGSLASLSDSVKAERAYNAIRAILPEDADQAEACLQDLSEICSKLLKKEHLEETERIKLHSFSREVVSYLGQEYFRIVKDPQNMWP